MTEDELKALMTFKKEGAFHVPLFVTEIDDRYMLAVYQGALSAFDLLVKYRQKIKDRWSKIRTPKHIHWAADMLIKMHEDREHTNAFLDFLLNVWATTIPIRSEEERTKVLQIESLQKIDEQVRTQIAGLDQKGEYSINFLIILGRLLMIQEKTNMEKAYMFGRLLEALRAGDDIFKIVSTATHVGRK